MKACCRGWVVWSFSRLGVMLVVLALMLLLFMVYRYVSCINASDSANQAAGDLTSEIVRVYAAPIGMQATYKMPQNISGKDYEASIIDGLGVIIRVPDTRCGEASGGAVLNVPFISHPSPIKNLSDGETTLVIRNLDSGVLIGQLDDCGECVKVSELHYDASGPHIDDDLDLNDEYVVFENACDKDCDLSGWSVKDRMVTRTRYLFSLFTLKPHDQVTLHSGSGTDTGSDLFWESRLMPNPSIWNNDGDTLYLRDSFGYLVLEYAYTVK